MDDNIILKFKYGSHVYGTQTPKSDEDFIVILHKREEKQTDPNYQTIEYSDFLTDIQAHKVSALECLSLLIQNRTDLYQLNIRELHWQKSGMPCCAPYSDNKEVPKSLIKFYNNSFDIKTLRHSFSHISSNSFVKAKKKCILSCEDPYIGMKSLFHSIRIIDYGIQIATNPDHSISDFTSCNQIWEDILAKQYEFRSCVDDEEKFKTLIEPWKKIYNAKHSEFRLVTVK